MFALFTVVFFTTLITAKAQPGGGAEMFKERMEKQKKELKDSVGLTDKQAEDVQAVNAEFFQEQMGMRGLSQEERQSKMKEINEKKLARFKEVLKDDALAQKTIDFLARQRQRMGGGMRGGGK